MSTPSGKNEKRKAANTSFEELSNIFRKSKVTIRSPTKSNETDMDRIAEAINTLREEMKQGFKENSNKTENLTRELENARTELQMLREEIKSKEESWKKEKQKLENKIQEMDERIEHVEKQRRRNNIVIKHEKFNGNQVAEGVRQFLKQKLNIDTHIQEAYQIKDITIAKVNSWEQKMQIMRKKRELKGTEIYIENDMTIKEREIQKQLRGISKAEKNKGKNVKVGYQKISINDKTYKWKDMQNDPKWQEILDTVSKNE